MVALRPVGADLRDSVLGLAPAPTQARFSGVAVDTLPAAERHPTRRPVAILRHGRAVGFFALDDADPICACAAPGPSIALRAFFVDRRVQREGIASAALLALPGFVRDEYPDARSIVLTVNISNPVASVLYERWGFVDAGRLHTGAVSGPQRILVLTL